MIEKKIKETLKPFMKNEEELRKETKKRNGIPSYKGR